MVEISENLQIPDAELDWSFVRASGPGGQNVNKVASKAVLRWRLVENQSLPPAIQARLRLQQRGRITIAGELILQSQRFRDQERNRQDCLDKLRQIVLLAATPPRPRRATRPTAGSKRRRLHEKKRRSETKAGRGRPVED